MRGSAARSLGEIKSERAVDGLLALLNDTDWSLVLGLGAVCDWAYPAISAILASNAADPGEDLDLLRQETPVAGPWDT